MSSAQPPPNPATPAPTPGWCHFPHDADVGVRGCGATQAEAFEQAALALSALVTEPERIVARTAVTISCAAPRADLLLVAWLNAVIYEMAVRRMLFGRYDVATDGATLAATAWGEAIDAQRHEPAVEPKGATYTALRVDRTPDGAWRAQCVIDV